MRKRPQVVLAVWSVGLALLGTGCPTTYVVLGEADAGAAPSAAGAGGAAGAAGAWYGTGGMYVDCSDPYLFHWCYGGNTGGSAGGAGGYPAGAGGVGGEPAGQGGVAGLWPEGGCNPPYVQIPRADGVIQCELPGEYAGAGGAGGQVGGAGGNAGAAGSADPTIECRLLYSEGSDEYYLCVHSNGQAGAPAPDPGVGGSAAVDGGAPDAE